MRYLGDLTLPIPTLPNGTTLDEGARDVLTAQLRALPKNQLTVILDAAEATDEGGSRKIRRYGIGAAVGIVAGIVAVTVAKSGKKSRK